MPSRCQKFSDQWYIAAVSVGAIVLAMALLFSTRQVCVAEDSQDKPSRRCLDQHRHRSLDRGPAV